MKQEITNIRVIKTNPDAVLPTQKIGDVGFDLYSVEDIVAEPHKSAVIDIGLAYASDPIALGNPNAIMKTLTTDSDEYEVTTDANGQPAYKINIQNVEEWEEFFSAEGGYLP